MRFGNGRLTESAFLLLEIKDADAARQWLAATPVSSAVATDAPPDTSLQIAFSAQGLAAIGLEPDVIEAFSDEFIVGMSGDQNRSRRLGDTGRNAPEHWDWGGEPDRLPHVLLLLYAKPGGLAAWRQQVTDTTFTLTATFQQDQASSSVYDTIQPLVGTVSTFSGKASSAATGPTNRDVSGSIFVSEFSHMHPAPGTLDTFSVTWNGSGSLTIGTTP